NQDVDFAGMSGFQDFPGRTLAPRHIAIEPRDAGTREQLAEPFLQPLRAAAEGFEVEVAAVGAAARNGLVGAAVVADEPIARRRASAGDAVQDAVSRAVGAATEPAALLAAKHGRIA